MGRNKNTNNPNVEKSNIEERIVDLEKSCEGSKNEKNLGELNQKEELSVTKNLKKAAFTNSMQYIKKSGFKEEKPDDIKEVKRSRGRPRKNLHDVGTNQSFEKSFTENDDDILKFENEVYENEETFNPPVDNTSTDLNLLPVDTSDLSETMKQHKICPNFESEPKIYSESIITISSEENSNSNPVIRALQCTPTSERNLSSPDILQVQFNPSSTKTYKNKRKVMNIIVDDKTREESIQKDTQIEKSKSQISKTSPNFEVNPNFIRNTRKKVLKYDVCDLLNKKSHKKIQIEARIDSMPVKSKSNQAKILDVDLIADVSKNETSPMKIIPKINNLPSIIRKNPVVDDFSVQDTGASMLNFIESISPKSLIQIQGKIVADNRSCYSRQLSNQDSLEDTKPSTFCIIEQQNLLKTNDLNDGTGLYNTETLIKRRPGRPKVKKDNPKAVSLQHQSWNINPSIIKEKLEIKNKSDKKNATITTLLEFENTADFVDSDTDNLVSTLNLTDDLQNKILETRSETIFLDKETPKKQNEGRENKLPKEQQIEKINLGKNVLGSNISSSIEVFENCNVNVTDQIFKEVNFKNKSELANISKNCNESVNQIKSEIIEKQKTIETLEMESPLENSNLIDFGKISDKEKSTVLKQNDVPMLAIKNIKEVRVLIKGIDNIKLKKPDRFNNLIEKQSGPLGKFLIGEAEEKTSDNLDISNNLDITSKSEDQNEKNIELVEETRLRKIDGESSELLELQNELTMIGYNEKEDRENLEDKIPSDNNGNIKTNMIDKKSINLLENAINLDNIKNVVNLLYQDKESNTSSCANMTIFSNERHCENNKSDVEATSEEDFISSCDDAQVNKEKNTEEINLSTILNLNDICNDNIKNLFVQSEDEKSMSDKNNEISTSVSETSENKLIFQSVKPKELKTGMDIWLEKVQLESKMKNLNDSSKKSKNDKFQKQKSKDESKTRNESKIKYDKEDQKISNSFKYKKDFKERSDTKCKLFGSKNDSKTKEEVKNKDCKDISKQDKKIYKDDTKIKNDSKIEIKLKSDAILLKQQLKMVKEESKLKNEMKLNKNEICSQLSKNETSLRTIDIFNFAAKDEIAQKVYNKKKMKKSDTNTPLQDKMSKVDDFKNENEKDSNQKKPTALDKSPKTSMKEKKSDKIFCTKEDSEKDFFKRKFELNNDENIKLKKRMKNDEEENRIFPNVCKPDTKLESEICDLEKIQENIEKEENPIEKGVLTNNEHVPEIVCNFIDENLIKETNVCDNSCLESSVKILSSDPVFQNPDHLTIEVQKDKLINVQTLVEKDETKKCEASAENKTIENDKSESLSHDVNDSTNEVLDPLKDIESFLEAAGNLLSRSHSSDDEKDSLGRRSVRNRTAEQSDDKNTSDQLDVKGEIDCYVDDNIIIKKLETENDTSHLKNKETYSDDNAITSNLPNVDNNINKDKISEFVPTPTKLQKEQREEWFSQIDSSIDKDLIDEVSFEQNKNFAVSTPLSKKPGTGPRTPPLPPPSSDEELEKIKMNENSLDKTSHVYNKNNLESEIANSIISTSIKIPISMATSIHELKFMGSPKNQNSILDEQLQMIEREINKKSKKKSETSQKDKELKKFLKTLKKNELSGDWKKTYKELKKIKKKSAEGLAISKSSLKYSSEDGTTSSNENEYNNSNNNTSTIRRSHRLKSIAMQQQNQQIAIGRGGLVRNDYEDLIRADLAQVQAQNTKFLKAMENSLNQFKQIKENEYKCERVISKEARRMMCDCFLTKEEEDRGEYGCGDDCLNRLLMIECGLKCNVGDRCTNKRFQRGQYAPCRVFMTEKKGCGIFAEVEIPAGEFIMEYVGEVVDSDQFEKRAEEYSSSKNKHFYFMSLRSNAIIDATGRGNISRFINHSCDPNAETQKWTVNGELRIGFFTTRTVSLGEEITFDYQFQRYGKQAQKCYCEAVSCRGWIGEEPDSDEEIEEEVGLDFKSKEDLEKISRDILSFADKDKLQTTDENVNDAQKLLTRKEDESSSDISKSILTDEELRIKQQEREQRKRDKQRKREIRLAQQKHDFLEDPDLEDEIYRLSKTGLKNQVQTLRLSRLIVRAKLLPTRLNLLDILRAGEIPCRRLFLDYHGLKLLHGWMNESESKDSTPTEDKLKMCFAILETLNCLPIPNKTMLKESKVYQIVQSWAQDKINTISPVDEFTSDSNSGHSVPIKDKFIDSVLDSNTKEIHVDIKNLAVKLLNDWEVLPEVFRIPRKERVEQMKEHEREADRRYTALHVADDERDTKITRDRYKKSRWDSSIKQRWPNKSDNGKERRKLEQEKLDDGLTKEQRRQAFAAKVAQDEAEKLNAEKRRNLEFEARKEFEFKCKFFLLDCNKTHPRDIPFCVDQKTNTWYTLDKRKIPTPPSHMHIKIPSRPKSTNSVDYKMPQLDLPQGWKFAIEPIHGRIYYYHVKIRRPQWEPPPRIFPLVNPENNISTIVSGNNITINTNNNSSESSDSGSESFDETDALSLLVQERAISPRKEEDRVYNQNEMRRYKENKEKIRRRKEEIKRRKARILLKNIEQPLEENNVNQLNESDVLPIADYLISSEEDDDTIVEELDSKLIEKIVKGESIVDELDALKIKKPLKRPLPIKEKSNGNGAPNSSSNSIIVDFKKKPKLEDKKHKINDDFKKSKSTNKNSRYFARKAKEKFRSDIAGIIVQHLHPYRKDSCQVGKITTNEDFKHLARKLTHFVMVKELKHCDSTGQILIVTDSVKNKSREFIKKYMAKYGEIYVRPETDPEYKEIPM